MIDIKRPIWEEDNSDERVESLFPGKYNISYRSALRIKNEDLRLKLIEMGWEYWDCPYIWEQGPTWSFTKIIDGIKIWFDWYYHSECPDGEIHWRGSMHGAYDFYPTDKYYHPYGQFDITPIHERDWLNMNKFQEQMIRVLKSLNNVTYSSE